MKSFLSFFAFLFFGFHLPAQAPIDFSHYQGIKCAGPIPEDFLKPSEEKYKEALATEIKESDSHKVADSKDDFLLETNYLIDGLLQSGKVLFGDTVTNYLNRVADHVLVDQPELRGKLRFYCLRSTEANAFSTNQGIIFVTFGLIAQLENEAQLAFILSHEIAHYERKHSINSYLQNEVIFNKRARYDSYNERIRVASDYSKDLELQADSIGMIRFLKTAYSPAAGIDALFVTQFSALPFEDLEFDAGLLQSSVMKLPLNIFLDSLRPIDLDKDQEDDTYSTHPNMATRRNTLEAILSTQHNPPGKDFIESEAAFYTIRRIARYETIRLELEERSYCEAFYNSYVLLKEDSTNAYLKTSIGKALYSLAKYKNHDALNDVMGNYFDKEGNQQQCYHLFHRLTAAQLNMVALRYLYQLSQTDSSYTLVAMRNDLAEEAVRLNNIHYTDLKSATSVYLESLQKKDTARFVAAKPVSATSTQSENPKAFVSKYDKLREEKKKQEQAQLTKAPDVDHSKFHLLAFSDIIDLPNVKLLFSNAETASAKHIADEEKRKQQEKEEEELGDEIYARHEQKKQTDIILKKQGIDTVVFVDPFYLEMDDFNYPVFVESEKTERELPALVLQNATACKVQASVVCPKNFKEGDVEAYNDLAVLNDWTEERALQGDWNFVTTSTDLVLPLAQKYHTNHFCYTRIYSYDHLTYYYTLMYDVSTGYEEINYEDKRVMKARATLLNSLLRGTMTGIRGTKKHAEF